VRRAGAAPRVRVLTYHRFGSDDARGDPFSVSIEDFEAQMRWLAERRLAVSLEQVLRFAAGAEALPDGAVLVTVDDGYACLHSRALPILRRHGIPAVAFVPAGLVGAADGPRVSWDDLGSLADAGVSIGSHGWSHRSLGRIDRAWARDEAFRSREELERRLGRPVAAFAYPFGTRADFDAFTTAILRDCGYACAFTAQHGAVEPGADPLLLPRIKVEGGEPPWVFERLCGGGLDAWRWVDRSLWRWQASETFESAEAARS
jgi:peptidoglycan/xylan/chitin deacetylase (PgdA/CDA1 family)